MGNDLVIKCVILDKHTKIDPLEDFLKNMKAMHNTTKWTPTMNCDITVQMKTLKETCNEKEHNTIRGIQQAKETKKRILITGQVIEKQKNNSDDCTRTKYGRVIRKLDRLTYI